MAESPPFFNWDTSFLVREHSEHWCAQFFLWCIEGFSRAKVPVHLKNSLIEPELKMSNSLICALTTELISWLDTSNNKVYLLLFSVCPCFLPLSHVHIHFHFVKCGWIICFMYLFKDLSKNHTKLTRILAVAFPQTIVFLKRLDVVWALLHHLAIKYCMHLKANGFSWAWFVQGFYMHRLYLL